MYRSGHWGISMLAYSPIAFGLMRLGREFIPLAIFGAFIVSSLTSFPDKDMDWKNYTVIVRSQDTQRFLPVAMLLAIPTRVRAALPTNSTQPLTTRSIISHRGFTHTVWFAGIVGGVLGAAATGIVMLLNYAGFNFVPYPDTVFIGFTALMGGYGIIAHMMGDVITPSGIEPFGGLPVVISRRVPLSDWKISLNLVRASNMFWNYILNVLGAVVIILAFVFGDAQIANQILDFLGALFASVR